MGEQNGKGVHAAFVASLFEHVLGHGDVCKDGETHSESRERQGFVEEPLAYVSTHIAQLGWEEGKDK